MNKADVSSSRHLAKVLWEEMGESCCVTATTYRGKDGTEENYLRFYTASHGDSPLFTKTEDALDYFAEVVRRK